MPVPLGFGALPAVGAGIRAGGAIRRETDQRRRELSYHRLRASKLDLAADSRREQSSPASGQTDGGHPTRHGFKEHVSKLLPEARMQQHVDLLQDREGFGSGQRSKE